MIWNPESKDSSPWKSTVVLESSENNLEPQPKFLCPTEVLVLTKSWLHRSHLVKQSNYLSQQLLQLLIDYRSEKYLTDPP